MSKGRKKIPTKVKALKGNPGKRLLNRNEPKFAQGARCPDWLDSYAKAEWKRIAGELRVMGLLERVSAVVLAGYCSAVSMLRLAEEDIQENGLFVPSERGTKRNPALAVKTDALKLIRSFASEFGITPSSKSRIHVPATQRDELETFLAQRA